MPCRRDAVLTHGHAPGFGNLLAYFCFGQHAAMARLGPLGQFDLDHLDLRRLGLQRKAVRIKVPVGGSAAKVARSDLPDQVTAVFAVVHRDAAFAGVVGKTAQRRAPVQGLDGVGRQRPKTHARDVEQRQAVRLRALACAHLNPKSRWVGLHRLQRVGDPFGAGAVHVLDAAKPAFVVLDLGSGIDHGPLVARKRQLFIVALQKVLAQLGADVFQRVAQASRQRVVAAHGLFGLLEIQAAQHKQQTQSGTGPCRMGPDHHGRWRSHQPGQVARQGLTGHERRSLKNEDQRRLPQSKHPSG